MSNNDNLEHLAQFMSEDQRQEMGFEVKEETPAETPTEPQKEETPVVDETPKEEVSTEAPAEPQKEETPVENPMSDPFDIIKFTDGKISSKEQFDEMYNKYQTLEKDNAELKDISEKLKNFNPYSSDDLYRLDKLKKDGKDEEYNKFAKILFGGSDNLSVLKNKIKADNPGLDDETIDTVVKSKYEDYFNGVPEDADADELKAYKVSKAMFEMDANKAKSDLQDEFKNIEIPEKFDFGQPQPKMTQDEINAAEKNRVDNIVNTWKQSFNEITTGSDNLSIEVGDKDKFSVNYKVDKESTEKVKAQVAQYIIDNNVPLTEETQKGMKVMFDNLMFLNNRESIINKIVSDVRSAMNEESALKYHNPSSLEKNKDRKPESDIKSDRDKDLEMVRKLNAG